MLAVVSNTCREYTFAGKANSSTSELAEQVDEMVSNRTAGVQSFVVGSFHSIING
jgi:hypothetical protein